MVKKIILASKSKVRKDILEKHNIICEVKPSNIDEDMIASISKVPDDNIDLIIRTGGDKRLSNFLLFQAAYAEIMFIDTLWPDFTRDDFAKCLDSFKKVNRRFGKRI